MSTDVRPEATTTEAAQERASYLTLAGDLRRAKELFLDPASGTTGFLGCALAAERNDRRRRLRGETGAILPHVLGGDGAVSHCTENHYLAHHYDRLAQCNLGHGLHDHIDILLTDPPASMNSGNAPWKSPRSLVALLSRERKDRHLGADLHRTTRLLAYRLRAPTALGVSQLEMSSGSRYARATQDNLAANRMSVSGSFFDRRTEGSEVKSRIVVKHSDAWARVIAHSQRGDDRLAYIDLYAGPGRYNEGAASTPLLVLSKAVERPYLHERLVTIFNDADAGHCRRLESEIAALPGIERLRHHPVVLNMEVGPELTKHLSATRLVPTFSFVDPCGYKGLSIDIIRHLIRDWGCDCLFFFNYRRINAALENKLFSAHIDRLFGSERATSIRWHLPRLRPWQREQFIHTELEAALRVRWQVRAAFRVQEPDGKTDHAFIGLRLERRKGF